MDAGNAEVYLRTELRWGMERTQSDEETDFLSQSSQRNARAIARGNIADRGVSALQHPAVDILQK